MDIFQEEFDVHTSIAYFQIANYQKAIEFATRASLPRPKHVYPHLILATCLAHLGQLDAAEKEISLILKLVPNYTLSVAKKSCVFVETRDIQRFVTGLRQAGLPEQPMA